MLIAIYKQNQNIIIKKYQKETIAPLDTTKEVLSTICLFHGATYDGRRRATTEILKVKQKVPILLSQKELLFPTTSPSLQQCAWINFYAIEQLEKDQNGSLITFIDGSTLIIPCSIRILKKQMQRCFCYDLYLNQHDKSN